MFWTVHVCFGSDLGVKMTGASSSSYQDLWSKYEKLSQEDDSPSKKSERLDSLEEEAKKAGGEEAKVSGGEEAKKAGEEAKKAGGEEAKEA